MFAIKLLNGLDPATGRPLARLVVGDEEETFPLFSDTWAGEDFARSWRESLRTFVEKDGDRKAALITEFYERDPNPAIRWWALYCEGKEVWVREQLLSREDLPQAVRPELVSDFVPHRIQSEDVAWPISEWHTRIEDVRDFIGNG